MIAAVESEFTRRDREARARQEEAGARAETARRRAAEAAERVREIAGGQAGPEGQAEHRATSAHESAVRGFTHARDAHLRSARAHDEAAEWADRRGDAATASMQRDAAHQERAAAAAEPVEPD